MHPISRVLPAHLHSRITVTLAGLHEVDTDNVMRTAAAGGTADNVERATRTTAAREAREDVARSIPPAPGVPDVEQSGCRAAVLDEAEHCDPTQPPDAQRRLSKQYGVLAGRAEPAGQQLQERKGRLSTAEQRQREHARRGAHRRAEHESIGDLLQRLKAATRNRNLLFGVEGLTALATSAAYFGLLDVPLGSVPASTWLQVIALALGLTLGVVMLTKHAKDALKRFVPTQGPLPVIGLVLMLVAIGIIRAISMLAPEQVSEGMGTLGSVALFIIAPLVSLVVARRIVDKEEEIEGLRAGIKRLHDFEEQEACVATEHAQEHKEAATEVAACTETIEAPARLQSWYESAVHDARRRFGDWVIKTEERVEKVRSAFLHVAQLEPVQIEGLRQEVYELREKVEVATPARHSGNGRLPGATLALLLALTAMAISAPACTAPPTEHTVVICDGSGGDSGCTREWLEATAYEWTQHAVVPGSSFTVIGSGGSFATTVVHPAVRVPERWRGNPRAARTAWVRAVIAHVGAIPIPDDGADGKTNVSDIVSALLVTCRIVRELRHEVHVVIASDGLLASRELGVNIEREGVPDVDTVLGRLRESGAPWDFSVLAALSWCGLGGHGLTAGGAAALERFWLALLAAAAAPAPALSLRCAGLPAPPASLRPSSRGIAPAVNE